MIKLVFMILFGFVLFMTAPCFIFKSQFRRGKRDTFVKKKDYFVVMRNVEGEGLGGCCVRPHKINS